MAFGLNSLKFKLMLFRFLSGEFLVIPDFLSPIDGPSWAEAVLSYAAPYSVRRDSQLQRMKGFTVPTWQKHFF